MSLRSPRRAHATKTVLQVEALESRTLLNGSTLLQGVRLAQASRGAHRGAVGHVAPLHHRPTAPKQTLQVVIPPTVLTPATPAQDPPSSVPAVQATLTLLASSSQTILPAAQNERSASEVAAAGTDQLGPLPIGQGRMDAPFAGASYVSPLMVVGSLSSSSVAPSSLSFRWVRTKLARTWAVRKSADGSQWTVTQLQAIGNRDASGTLTPADDTGAAEFNAPDAGPNGQGLSMYDNSGLYLGGIAGLNLGDYVLEQKQFSYTLEVNQNGVWQECASLQVGQTIAAQKVGQSGSVPADWQGIENTNAVRTLPVQITQEAVRAVVGGTVPIAIDPQANA